MRTLALITACALASTACGAVVDFTYLVGGDQYHRTADETQPLPQTIERHEYEGVIEQDGQVRLACYTRTRQLERRWQVTRTYRYRGGYDESAYVASMILDVVFGGVTAGSIAGICLKEDSNISCWNTLWATPFAIDLGYSLVRYLRAKPPVLIDKSSSTGTVGLIDAPAAEEETACEDVAALWLGAATGPDDLQVLTGHAEGSAPRALAADAVPLDLTPDRTITLHPDAAERWALHPALNLYVTDHDGTPHLVATDRCALLRALQTTLSGSALSAYQAACVPTTEGTPAPTATAPH